jgi:uncharacterized glyoxalase superfamily protein PhnB
MEGAKGNGSIYPSLFYRDASSAIDWICKAFGFEVLMRIPGEKPDQIAHSELKLGDGIIMVGSAENDPSMRSPLDLEGLHQGLYIYIENVDEHFSRAKSAGATIEQEPKDEDYGGRVYGVRDPEGHRWWFGNYRPSPEPYSPSGS